MKKLLLIALIFVSGGAMAQNVGIGTANPDESAILDLKSSNKGFLLPRLTEKQKALIPQPAEGLMIYQTDASQGVYLYQGGNWKNMGSANVTTSGATENAVTAYTPYFLLTADGSGNSISSGVFVNPSNGNVGIGTTNPITKFQVNGAARFFDVIQSVGDWITSYPIVQYLDSRPGGKFWNIENGRNSSNLGFYSETNGSVFNITQNGNVGIGITNPNYKLEISNGSISGIFNPNSQLNSFFLGTNSNNPLVIGVNNAEKMRLLSSGNVLIGTTVDAGPGYKLQVNGSGIFKDIIQTSGDWDLRYPIIQLLDSRTSGKFWNIENGRISTNLGFYSETAGNVFNITQLGNVGIGTATPTQKLDVVGSIQQSAVKSSLVKTDGTGKLVAATAGTDYVAASTNSVGTIAKFSAPGTVANSAISEASISNGAGVKVDSKSAGYLAVGDFGAGTPMSIPAGYRLVVQDGIITEKVKVAVRNQTDWADYVFEPNYSLMPLSEVEKFVKENKHLPNVPSADEMVKKGVEVGQTSKMFMEKIEELTLYMIEMKKEIEDLKAENTRLKK